MSRAEPRHKKPFSNRYSFEDSITEFHTCFTYSEIVRVRLIGKRKGNPLPGDTGGDMPAAEAFPELSGKLDRFASCSLILIAVIKT